MSEDGFQDRVSPFVETELAESPVGVVGGCVSGQGAVAALIDVLAERLPAASYASTESA